MNQEATYSVVSKGELQPGRSLAEVQESFAKTFKVTAEQAAKIVGCKKVIKKDLDLQKAKLYQQRLEGIGMIVSLQQNKPQPASTFSFESLALEPMEGEAKSKPASHVPAASSAEPASQPAAFACPKCGAQQPKSEQCVSCGIFFAKLERAKEIAPARKAVAQRLVQPPQETVEEQQDEEADESPTAGLSAKAMGAAAAAALIGALVWKGIAVLFNFELGLVAWGVGGLIGFAAVKMGSRGDIAGAVCGVLALLSIVAGKYLIIQGYVDEFNQLASEGYVLDEAEKEEMRPLYEESIESAKYYVAEVDTEQEMRVFMVDYGYTEALDPVAVGAEEVQFFKQYAEPNLIRFASSEPTLEEWLGVTFDTVATGLEEISTLDLLKEDFSWIDLIFYALGISTAFRLARGY